MKAIIIAVLLTSAMSYGEVVSATTPVRSSTEIIVESPLTPGEQLLMQKMEYLSAQLQAESTAREEAKKASLTAKVSNAYTISKDGVVRASGATKDAVYSAYRSTTNWTSYHVLSPIKGWSQSACSKVSYYVH